MKNYANQDLIKLLVKARKAKGLSQKDLGEKVGWPQSHISKMESGQSDIRLSGLIELARALDFELTLVPRKTVPAVQMIVQPSMPSENDRTVQAQREIAMVIPYLTQKDLVSDPAFAEAAKNARETLKSLQNYSIEADTYKSLKETLHLFRDAKKYYSDHYQDIQKMAYQISQATTQLQKLKNNLQGTNIHSAKALHAAYELEEDDDA